jgi:hypothetical protein
MFLKQPELDVSFRVTHEGKTYMIYASTGSLKCFECGDVGHKKSTCPHKVGISGVIPNSAVDSEASESNREQMIPNVIPAVIPTVDVEVRNESNVEQTVQNETEESDRSVVASCSGVGHGKGIFDMTVGELKDSLGSVGKESEDVQTEEGVNMEVNELLSQTEVVGEEELRDEDTLSDISEFGSQNMDGMYSLDEINDFLDTTFGKVVEVRDFFPDAEKFVLSVKILQRTASYDELSKKKRFRLKKLITKLRKDKGMSLFKK